MLWHRCPPAAILSQMDAPVNKFYIELYELSPDSVKRRGAGRQRLHGFGAVSCVKRPAATPDAA